MDGFFVFLVNKPRMGGPKQWTCEPVEKVDAWPATHGATPEEAIELQKAQYKDRVGSDQPVPPLQKSSEGPMASGKMTRFISV